VKSKDFFIIAVIGVITIVLGCTDKSAQIQTNEDIGKSFVEAWSSQDGEMLAVLFADSLIYFEIPTGRIFQNRQDIVNYVTATCYGMPDMKSEVVSVIANDKMVAVE